jgi:hypothetical protein
MFEQPLPWVLAAAMVVALAALGWAAGRRRKRKPAPLPTEWALTARPVFSTDERRLYRQLREALPHHIVLAKLPLVRLCQPNDPQQVRYWYELLGSTHVTFAVCSANGRVLAAIDFDSERGGSRRALQIKQAVLGACRIRYLRCPVDHLPSVPELQLLVPQAGAPARSPQSMSMAAAAGLREARESLAGAVASRRRQRRPLWQDSGFFHDSFFGGDSRMEPGAPSEFTPYAPPAPAAGDGAAAGWPTPAGATEWADPAAGDTAGVVVDAPRYGTSARR